jgi:WS/DGAT/MGAT family acyltransferase
MAGIDPMFIYSETPATPMEVAYACIFNPATVPGGYSFAAVRRVLEERVPTMIAFRRRLVNVPFGLDHPRWVDDPEFDLDNHLQRVALPAPHGEAELRSLVAEILGRPLCPEQPPWEMHLIEGLAGGKIGLVAKVHHSVLDGVAGAQLLAQLLDLSPQGRPLTDVGEPWRPPALPSSTQLLTDAIPNLLASPIRTLRAIREVGRTAVRMARCALDGDTGPVSIPLFAPDSLQRPILPGREVALAILSLKDISAVRQRFGVTVNDVVLTLCSGALRSHLGVHEQQATGPLVAIVPVSVRMPSGGEAVGNHLSAMFVSLGNDRDDPLERLEAIIQSCGAVKAQERSIGYGPMASAVTDALPPVLAMPVLRAGQQAGILRRLRAGNLMVSNVPGPDFPLYFAGMRMEAVYPMGPVVDGLALNITVQSYEDSLFVGINAGATVVPDLPGLARAMVEELALLLAATLAAAPGAVLQPNPPTSPNFVRGASTPKVPRTSARTAHADPNRPRVRRQLPIPVRHDTSGD